MTNHFLCDGTLKTLSQQYEHHKLILMHPDSRCQTLLIAALLADPPCPLFYYQLGDTDAGLAHFVTGLIHGLAAQSPLFGRRANAALRDAGDDVEAIATALAEDIGDLAENESILILDEYDRLDSVPEVNGFMVHLLARLPTHSHILINSRTLPQLPWVGLVAKGQAVVLKDDKVLPSGFYMERISPNPSIEIHALGSDHVYRNGQRVTEWDGHLPRLLLYYVVDRLNVTRREICEAFWPELSTEKAVNIFHVTKRRLHQALDADVLVFDDGVYSIDPDLDVYYDVFDFVDKLVVARQLEDEDAWQRAVAVYGGDYLPGYDEAWIGIRRESLRKGKQEALDQVEAVSGKALEIP